MRKFVLLVFSVLFFAVSAQAQSHEVTGTVTSGDGSALPGVTVMVKGTQIGASTDGYGKYTITVSSGAILQFSYVGYESQDITVGSRNRIDVQMKEGVELEDVVVVGYGTARKVGTVIGSVAKVDSDKFESVPTTNVMDALQGRVPGLNIFTSSGEPSATSSLRLHGVGTINTSVSQEPLVLLDGVNISYQTLMMMNPSNIESITVLKDASATSIYGARAANGVIYATSKKGRLGDRAVVTFKTQYSISKPVDPKLKALSTNALTDYMLDNAFIGESTYDMLREQGNTNWHNEIFRRAAIKQADLSVIGGGEMVSYLLSASIHDEDGIARGSDQKRYTFNTNIEVTPYKWLKTGLSMNVGYTKYHTSRARGSSGVNPTNAATGASLIPSYQKARNEDGSIIPILGYAGGFPSPLVIGDFFRTANERIQLNGSMFAEVRPIEGLVISSRIGANSFDFNGVNMTTPDYYKALGLAPDGVMSKSFQRNFDLTVTNTVEYTFDINREHNFVALVGQESYLKDSKYDAFGMKGYTDSRFMFLSHGTEMSGIPSYTRTRSAQNSLFARIDYNYREKYIFDALIRQDASSRFASGERRGTFWAVGAMWNLKKENFLANVRPISQLSVKFSMGTQGNAEIPNYLYLATLGKTQYMGESGWGISGVGNPSLKWEKQTKITAGFKLELFSRVSIEAEYYHRETRDMLTPRSLPGSTGLTTTFGNVGSMLNQGIDLSVNANIFSNKDWSVGAFATFNYNKNEVTELYEGNDYVAYGDVYAKIGMPHHTFRFPVYLGADPDTGKPRWEGPDNTIVNDIALAESKFLNKSVYPPYMGGFGINASWKGISFAADFSWVSGKYMYNNTRFFSENAGFVGSFGQTEGLLDYWKQPGDKAFLPSVAEQKAMGGRVFDDSMLEDASFVRLKNVRIGYSLPQSWLKKTGAIKGVQVWFSGRNLLTWTSYKGLDPEVDAIYEVDNYPNTRQFTFGIEVKF